MLIPTAKTFVFQEDLGSTEANDGIRDPINFLMNPPRVMAVRTTNLSIGTGGNPKLVTLDNETIDNDSMHDLITNPSRVVFQTAGTYHIGGSVCFASNATGRREGQIRLNSAGDGATGTRLCRSVVPATNGETIVSFSRYATFGVGNYVELFGFQDSGGALDVVGGNDNTYLWARMIGT